MVTGAARVSTRHSATPPRFAVVGTGRSGTGYVAAALRACGVECGHEEWWTPLAWRRRPGLDGDSSWLALPDIESGAWAGPALHVTRHPVDVVSSLLGIGFFEGRGRYRAFLDFALEHEPELRGMGTLEASVEWWARWNERCARVADLTVGVSELPGRLGDVGDLIGRALDPGRGRCVPSGVNHRQRGEADEAEVWRMLDGRAEPLGYTEPRCG